MTKLLPSFLFASMFMIGIANQVCGAQSSPETGDKMQQKGWFEEVKDAFGSSENMAVDLREVVVMMVFLIIGGLLALYIRFLYRRCNGSVSNSDSVARIFPLLTMVTIGVIAVVKSSLALSLGLVGALSIVRFRAAIKDPEELVYLFLCIGIGLALGATDFSGTILGLVKQMLLAFAIVIVATLFVLGIHFTTGISRRQNLLLTITGDSNQHFGEDESGVMSVVEELVGRYTLQRFDLEQDRGQVRIVINQKSGRETAALIEQLRARLPGCEFSYVNLESTL
jgi:hypothetical protein